MFLCKFYTSILLELCIASVRSAPSLNNSPQSSSDLVIIASNDLVSNDTSKNSNISQHWLTSAEINSLTSIAKQELNTSSLSKTTQSSVRSTESKLINLAKTNTSSASSFTLAVLRSLNDLHTFMIGFMSRILDASFRDTAVQRTSIISSPDATSFQPGHARLHHHRSAISPSLYHFTSPSRRMFLAFSRLFRNL